MKMRMMICTLMMLLLTFCCSIPAQAAGSVTFLETAGKFVFLPGSDNSTTDLFSDLKSVIPGDSITQEIRIQNDVSNKVKIKLYIRALDAKNGSDDFMSQLNLTVKQHGESILFDAPANETAQLTDWVYLGTIFSGGTITLDVTLDVPVTMGNEFQKQVGYVVWEFMVEELPVEPTDPLPPKTGDDSQIFFYAGIMLACLTALLLLVFFRKRKQ